MLLEFLSNLHNYDPRTQIDVENNVTCYLFSNEAETGTVKL